MTLQVLPSSPQQLVMVVMVVVVLQQAVLLVVELVLMVVVEGEEVGEHQPQLSDGQHRCELILEPANRKYPTAGWTSVDWTVHSVFSDKYNVFRDLFHLLKFERGRVLGPINQQVNRIIKSSFKAGVTHLQTFKCL